VLHDPLTFYMIHRDILVTWIHRDILQCYVIHCDILQCCMDPLTFCSVTLIYHDILILQCYLDPL